MKHVFSVSQVNRYVKGIFDQDFMLKRIYIRGEVSNCKYHSTGHLYFSLKDESSSIGCVMFAGNRAGLRFRLTDGQSVIVLGSISVFERDGKYQLYAQEILEEGTGTLKEKFEALKKKLEELGMFDRQYKRPIPAYARRIGVVTAPTGAAIRDIQNISARRNPYVQVILYPALVQGKDAAPSIIKGIEMLEGQNVDLIIVGRGGGSMEDLWAFNEESVAYAIFNCSVPVISAVGHETDFTIADFVADLRAPTPSAAAELAVAETAGILEQIGSSRERLKRQMRRALEKAQDGLHYREKRLDLLSPQSRIREARQILMEKEEKLGYRMAGILEAKKHRMLLCAQRLKGLSPLDKLKQGYSYVADQNKKTVTTTDQVKEGDELSVYVTDGCIRAAVTGIRKDRLEVEG